jgi:hypothetical protein
LSAKQDHRLEGVNMSLRRMIAASCFAAVCTLPAAAQTVIFNSNGFESPYNLGNINGQQGWAALGSTGAGTIVNTTVFAGTQAFRINGQNLTAGGFGGSSTSFWVQEVAPNLAASFKPVAAGQPIVMVNWRQFVTGTTSDIANMPFSGVHIEGFRANGLAQLTTEIYIDFNDSVAVFDGAGAITGPAIPGLRNTWVDLSARLDYTTQSLNVNVNGVPYLTDVPFANYIPAQVTSPSIGIAETDLIGVSGQLATGFTPNNSAFFDNFSVVAMAVPEPTVFILAGAGIGLFGVYRWRQRRANQQLSDQVCEPSGE